MPSEKEKQIVKDALLPFKPPNTEETREKYWARIFNLRNARQKLIEKLGSNCVGKVVNRTAELRFAVGIPIIQDEVKERLARFAPKEGDSQEEIARKKAGLEKEIALLHQRYKHAIISLAVKKYPEVAFINEGREEEIKRRLLQHAPKLGETQEQRWKRIRDLVSEVRDLYSFGVNKVNAIISTPRFAFAQVSLDTIVREALLPLAPPQHEEGFQERNARLASIQKMRRELQTTYGVSTTAVNTTISEDTNLSFVPGGKGVPGRSKSGSQAEQVLRSLTRFVPIEGDNEIQTAAKQHAVRAAIAELVRGGITEDYIANVIKRYPQLWFAKGRRSTMSEEIRRRLLRVAFARTKTIKAEREKLGKEFGSYVVVGTLKNYPELWFAFGVVGKRRHEIPAIWKMAIALKKATNKGQDLEVKLSELEVEYGAPLVSQTIHTYPQLTPILERRSHVIYELNPKEKAAVIRYFHITRDLNKVVEHFRSLGWKISKHDVKYVLAGAGINIEEMKPRKKEKKTKPQQANNIPLDELRARVESFSNSIKGGIYNVLKRWNRTPELDYWAITISEEVVHVLARKTEFKSAEEISRAYITKTAKFQLMDTIRKERWSQEGLRGIRSRLTEPQLRELISSRRVKGSEEICPKLPSIQQLHEHAKNADLTPHERVVFQGMVKGHNNHQIAAWLALKAGQVNNIKSMVKIKIRQTARR